MKNFLLLFSMSLIFICVVSIAQPKDVDSLVINKAGLNVEVVWKYKTNNMVTSSPVYSDGVIYIGAGSSLLAIDTLGKKLFSFKTQGPVKCRPAVTNTKIYFQSGDGWLYCISKVNGKEIWKIQLDATDYLQLYDFWDYYHSSPLIINNMLYVGSTSTFLYAIESETGKVIWKFKTNHIIRSSPVYYSGNIYFGSFDGCFYSVNAMSGKEVWRYKMPEANYSRCGEIQSSAVISDNKVIFGSRDGRVHALNTETGKEIWNYSHDGSWVISSPAIYDSIVIAGSSDAHFINAMEVKTGKEVWRYFTKFNVFSSPIIANSTVFCGDGNAYNFMEGASFFALDLYSGKEMWRVKTDGQIWSSPIKVKNRIYFATYAGTIYAINTD